MGVGFEDEDNIVGVSHGLQVTVKQTPFRIVYGQEDVVPLEFMVPSLKVALEHDLNYNQIL